jgi:hypothetical protein
MSSNFDLSSFEKPPCEKSASAPSEIPYWVATGSKATRALYSEVCKETALIEQRIKADENLSLNQRRIVKSRIAKNANYDPSVLTERRQPDLLGFIAEQDILLEALWKGRRRQRSSGVKKLKRVELERLVTKLKREKKELLEKKCKDSIEEALNTVFLTPQMQLSKENMQLRASIEEANETIANLRMQLRKAEFKIVG